MALGLIAALGLFLLWLPLTSRNLLVNSLFANRQLIAELAEKNRLPVMCPYRDYVEAGGLMAYAVDLAELEDLRDVGVRQLDRDLCLVDEDTQLARFAAAGSRHPVYSNAQMGPQLIRRFCPVSTQSDEILRAAIDRLGLSARAYHRVLKVARTIADLSKPELDPATYRTSSNAQRVISRLEA